MTWKQALSILAAFALGAFAVYDIMSHRPSTNPNEEWGVIVVHFPLGGPSLWGLFESRADCLKARTAFIEEYGNEAGAAGTVKKGVREVAIQRSRGIDVLVTFSCLPLSEIRGLALHERPDSN